MLYYACHCGSIQGNFLTAPITEVITHGAHADIDLWPDRSIS
jgi:hypothetical protein